METQQDIYNNVPGTNAPAINAQEPQDIITRSLGLFKSGSQILQANRNTVEQLVAEGEEIAAMVILNDGELDQDLDADANAFLVKCRTETKRIFEDRSPITQMAKMISSEFTALENRLDPKIDKTIPAIIQGYRDARAKKLVLQQQDKDKQARAAQAKQTEAANLKQIFSTQLLQYFTKQLQDRKKALQDVYNSITLDNLDTEACTLELFNTSYAYQDYMSWQVGAYIGPIHHSPEDVKLLITQIHEMGPFQEYAKTFADEMQILKNQLVAKLPGLQAELQQIAETAKNNQEEADRLQKEKDDRQKLQDEEQKQLDAQKLQQQESTIAVTAQQEKTGAMFTGIASVTRNEKAPETRTGYVLQLLSAEAIPLVFEMWYRAEGMLADDMAKVGKKTIDQMTKFCADLAQSTGTMIESEFVNYEPQYKAVARKPAKAK